MFKNISAFLFSFILLSAIKAQTNVPAKPVMTAEEEVLSKLLAIATDPNNNGLQLVDTFSLNSKYLTTNASTLRYPNAIGTAILSRTTKYNGNIASINYTWASRLKKIPQADSQKLFKTLGQVQEIIARLLPGVTDSFYTANTYSQASQQIWEWKTNKGAVLRLKALTGQRYNIPDEVDIQLTATKVVKQDKKKITDSLFRRYDELIKDAPSRKDLAAYCITLYTSLEQEGIEKDEAITKIRPIFKWVADKDITAAFDVLMNLPEPAMNALRSDLSTDQLASVRKLAQGVVDDFRAAQYGTVHKQEKKEASKIAVRPALEHFNAYYSNAVKPDVTSKYVYIFHRDTNGIYNIKEVRMQPKRDKKSSWQFIEGPVKNVSGSYFDAAGGKWLAVHIGNCVACNGSGLEITRTPYSYYREEKGIYNKYTYSGSGVNVTSKTCGMCYGAGYSIMQYK